MEYMRLRPEDEDKLFLFAWCFVHGYGNFGEILSVVDKLCQLNYLQGQVEGVRASNKSLTEAIGNVETI